MKIKGRIIKSALSFAIILAMVSAMPGLVKANNENTGSADLKVDYHTKQEIANYIQMHPADKAYTTSYAVTPKTSSPYDPGELSDETLQGALTLLNTYRYIAGIPNEVALSEYYNRYAQAASLVNAVNGNISHTPSKPSDMDEKIYSDGQFGCGQSNLAAGMSSLGDSFKRGWMSDSDSGNIKAVGHRRWVLDPKMEYTGFGFVEKSNSTYRYYSTMFSVDPGYTNENYDAVAWPAQNTPTGYFLKDDPWTVSFNEYIVNASVTLTCVNTGQTWNFSTDDINFNYKADGFINIENGGYGQKACIIFRPEGGTNVSKNYSYNVSISGVKYEDGHEGSSSYKKDFSVSYTVDFFDLSDYSLQDEEVAKVMLNLNGGTGINDLYRVVKNTAYGNIPTPTREGYRFLGWFTSLNGGTQIKSTDICTKDITLYAHWSDQAPYTVYHYTENLDGNSYTLMATETLNGKVGDSVPDNFKTYEGFGADTRVEINHGGRIAADGSTVQDIFYSRSSYNLEWDFNGGDLTGSASYSKGSIKYEAKITDPIINRKGYTFKKWSPEFTGNMPAGNITYKAVWEANTVYYDIKYYTEKLDGEYELSKTVTKSAKTDEVVTAEVLNFTGFTSPAAKTVTIKADSATVVEYYYKRNSYKLTWDFDGGTVSGDYTQAGTYKFGTKIVKPTTVKKAGYTFNGWSDNATSMPAKDLTLKALYKEVEKPYYTVEHYKQNVDGSYSSTPNETDDFIGTTGASVTPEVRTYTGFTSPSTQTVTVKSDGTTVVKYKYARNKYLLTWNLDGGSAPEPYTHGEVMFGAKITPPVPTKAGCVFDGWDYYTIPTTMPSRNVTIRAFWKVSYSTVSFDVNGGKAITSTSKTIPSYTAYGELPTTSRTGYSFSGWYTAKSGGTKVTADTVCEGDITLYAHWKAKTNTKYTVEHYKQKLDGTYNKTASETEALTGKTNASVTPAVKEYNGFTAPETQTEKIKANGSLVIKYYYTRNSYTLKWDLDGGTASETYTKGNVKYGTAITAPVPVKKGYTFAGWSKTVPEKMPAKNQTFKALWEVNYVTVSFNVNGGKAITEKTRSVQENTAYGELPKTSRTGYTFSGWYTAKSGGTKVTADSICEGNITLYAHWKAKTNTKYTVEHYKQKVDGTYTAKPGETESFMGKTNASVTPEVKTYKGYISPAAQTQKIKADGTLVIKYYYDRNSYTLTWDFAGGSAPGKYTKGSVKYGAVITAPVPERAGYKFNGWSVEVPEKMPANDLTIKAKWKANTDTPYTVEHYKQKVDGTYNNTANETESFTGKTNASVTPEVKTYKGFTSPELQTVKIKADGTLVVKYYYTRNSYKLTWDFAGGSAKGSYTKGNVKYGAKITAPVPVKDGYEFTGWDKTVAEKMPAKNVTYTATWKKLTQKEKVEKFVERFYTIILERPADADGLQNWSNKLLNKEVTGAQVATGFIKSSEFENKKVSDGEYVKRLYRSIFGREADSDGYNHWVKELKNGTSRDDVLSGFINSPEFNNLCEKYGINTGRY